MIEPPKKARIWSQEESVLTPNSFKKVDDVARQKDQTSYKVALDDKAITQLLEEVPNDKIITALLDRAPSSV